MLSDFQITNHDAILLAHHGMIVDTIFKQACIPGRTIPNMISNQLLQISSELLESFGQAPLSRPPSASAQLTGALALTTSFLGINHQPMALHSKSLFDVNRLMN